MDNFVVEWLMDAIAQKQQLSSNEKDGQ